MAGLRRILKLSGEMKIKGHDGKTVLWAWDYVNDKARIKSEMTRDELNASEKERFKLMKEMFANKK